MTHVNESAQFDEPEQETRLGVHRLVLPLTTEANRVSQLSEDTEKMARRRFQNPEPKRLGKWWYLLFWQDEFLAGKRIRKRKRIRLAPATTSEREVKKIAAEYLRPLNQGLTPIGAAVGFEEYVEAVYKSTLLPLMAKSTQSRSLSVIKNYLNPAFGSKCMRDLTPLTLQRYFSDIPSSRLSYESRDKIRDVMSSILSSAVTYGILIKNPMDGVRLAPGKRGNRIKPYIDPVKFSSLLALIPEPYATMVHVAAFTGLRASELIGLRWRNVHADSIAIEERYCRGEWGAPKSQASNATIPVNRAVIDRIHRLKTITVEIRAGNAVRRYPAVKSCGPDDLVFASVVKAAPMRDNAILGIYILDPQVCLGYTYHMDSPNTLQEAIVYFSDPDRAFEYAKKLRWPDGKVVCPRCGKAKHSFIKTRRVWFCYECNKQFSLKLGTVFEDSPLGLDKWMTGFWLLVNCKNGVSSMEIHRALGITQKAAWFMLQRLRLAIQDDFFGSKLGGEVEVDESFIGGKARNMHVSERKRRITGTGTKDKTAVMGILERGGKIRTTVVPSRKKRVLQDEVRKHVEAGAALYSDALLSYEGLATDYAHKVVDHAVQYVDGRVHTNGLENFWSLLKRGISGTYVSVEPFHLFRYLDEQTFRFNTRKDLNDGQRFNLAMSQIGGKRLTYSQLTGKDESPRYETTGTREAQIPF